MGSWAEGCGYLVIPLDKRRAALDAARTALVTTEPGGRLHKLDAWRQRDGSAVVPYGAQIKDLLTLAGFSVEVSPTDPATLSIEYDDRDNGVTEILDLLAPFTTDGEVAWQVGGQYRKDIFRDGVRRQVRGYVAYEDQTSGWVLVEKDGDRIAVTTDRGDAALLTIDWDRAASDASYSVSLAAEPALEALPADVRQRLRSRLAALQTETS